MRRSLLLWSMPLLACGLVFGHGRVLEPFQVRETAQTTSTAFLGFDRNQYPGDAALESLRKTFAFAGYWLNVPPGETANSWQGKRGVLNSNAFGFVVLFNGRLYRELKSAPDPRILGNRDAAVAVEAAKREGFPSDAIIFLDQEEGGRMLPEQRAYVFAWIDEVNASMYRAGVYCSGIPAPESHGTAVVTANDLRETANGRDVSFFVYNDSCPPSTGCVFPGNPLPPERSGVPYATVWQFAQSPRRRKVTAACPSSYAPDGNCYAPALQSIRGVYVDLDSATSADPSSGRR